MEKKRRRYPESFKKETVVQIEIDAAEIGRNYAVSTAVVGDARGVPAHLVSRPAA